MRISDWSSDVCSSDLSRDVHAAAAAQGLLMLDAPVSGGVAGADAGTLTFMVGGPEQAFASGRPLFEVMDRTIDNAGGAGNGQAAKICNQMILGISMIAVADRKRTRQHSRH